MNNVSVTRLIGQTKFTQENVKGLLTIHDHGSWAASVDHKDLFNGLNTELSGSYLHLVPTTIEKKFIMMRLFGAKG